MSGDSLRLEQDGDDAGDDSTGNRVDWPRLVFRVEQDPVQARALEAAVAQFSEGERPGNLPTVRTTLELDVIDKAAAMPRVLWKQTEPRGVVFGEGGPQFPLIKARRAHRSPDGARVIVELVLGAGDETDFVIAKLR